MRINTHTSTIYIADRTSTPSSVAYYICAYSVHLYSHLCAMYIPIFLTFYLYLSIQLDTCEVYMAVLNRHNHVLSYIIFIYLLLYQCIYYLSLFIYSSIQKWKLGEYTWQSYIDVDILSTDLGEYRPPIQTLYA